MNIDTQAYQRNRQQKTDEENADYGARLRMLAAQAAQRENHGYAASASQVTHPDAIEPLGAGNTTAVAIKYSMVAPEIQGDTDDGQLAIPTPFPMQVTMYVDFPTASLDADTQDAKMGVESAAAVRQDTNAGAQDATSPARAAAQHVGTGASVAKHVGAGLATASSLATRSSVSNRPASLPVAPGSPGATSAVSTKGTLNPPLNAAPNALKSVHQPTLTELASSLVRDAARHGSDRTHASAGSSAQAPAQAAAQELLQAVTQTPAQAVTAAANHPHTGAQLPHTLDAAQPPLFGTAASMVAGIEAFAGESTESADASARSHSVNGGHLTPPEPAFAFVSGPPVEQQPAQHTALPQERAAHDKPVGHNSDSPAGRTAEGLASPAVPGERATTDSVEMTYKFSSWGPTEAVALKLDRSHPGAQMLATASNGQVHKILDDALRRPMQDKDGRPAMRLDSQAGEGAGEVAGKQGHKRNSQR